MRVLRKLRHWLAIALLSLTALVALVITLAVVATQVPAGRELVQGTVNDALSSALDARLEIERIDSISLFYVQTGPASLVDKQGHRVASLKKLSAHLNPFALLAGRVHITHAFVDGAYVDLGTPTDDEPGGLLAVFQSDEPTAPEPEDKSSLRIVLSDVRLAHATVDATIDGARYQVRDLSARSDLDIADRMDVHVSSARATLMRDASFAASLKDTAFTMLGSGAMRADTHVVAHDARIWAKLDLSEPKDHRQKLEANVAVSKFSATQLAVFGIRDTGFEEPLSLRATARAQTSEAFDDIDFRVAVDDGSYANVALPKVFGRGRYVGNEGVRADEIFVAYENLAELKASGTFSNEGELKAEAKLRSDSLAEVPAVDAWMHGLAGKLNAEITAHKHTNDAWNVSASLKANRAGFDTAHVRALTLDAKLNGMLSAPVVEATLRADEITSPQIEIPHLDLSANGDGRHYSARAGLGKSGGFFARADRVDDTWTASGDGVVALKQDDWIRAGVTALRYAPNQPIAFEDVHANYRGAVAHVKGSLAPSGDSHLRAKVSIPNIQTLSAGWVTLPVDGKVSVDAKLDGRLAKPKLQVSARYECAELQGLKNVVAQLSAGADLPKRRIELKLDVDARDTSVHVTGTSVLRGGALNAAAFEKGKHDVEVVVDRFPLAQLKQWPRDRFDMRVATLSGSVKLQGTLADPTVEADTKARLHFSDDPAPVTLALTGKYAQEHIELKLAANDQRGEFLRSSLNTDLARTTFSSPQDGALALLTERAWDASLWLGARRVDELPAMRALEVDRGVWPAAVSGEVKFSHRPGQEPEGDVNLKAVWPPPAAHSPVQRCGQDHEPVIALVVKMQNGKLDSKLHTKIAGKEVLVLSTQSNSPIGEWLRPKQARPISIDARFSDLHLADLPVVCDTMEGRLNGTANLSRALTQAVTARVDVRGTQMRWGKAPFFEANVSAKADDKSLIARAELKTGKGFAQVNGKLPIDAGGRMPSIRMDAPAEADVTLKNVDVRALLGAVPVVSARNGSLDGELHMNGSLDAPNLRGELALQDVSVVLPELGQPFEHVSGKLSLDGKTLKLARTRIHDREGWVDVSGEMHMQTLETWDAKAQLHASNLPVRRSGVILARVDTSAEVKVGITPERTQLDVAIRDTRVELTGADLGDIQSLNENPDIVFVVDGHVDEAEETSSKSTALLINIDASDPMWIRREDFSAQLRAKLRVSSDEEGPSVSGEVNIDRGVVELMGQMFDIEHGNIRFQGGHEIEPVLDLTASRTPPGGKKVTIEAKGQLDKPTLRFLLDDAPVTAGEALAAATGTRTSDQSGASVQSEIGSMATGIAAGVLTLGARRELGEWVPVLAYENNDGQSRLRAGVGAKEIIPKFLRKVVVDAYVEGILTRDQKDAHSSENTGTGAGVLLELRFPKNFVSETQYGPGTRWSQDLSWEP